MSDESINEEPLLSDDDEEPITAQKVAKQKNKQWK